MTRTIAWGHDRLAVELTVPDDAPVRLARLAERAGEEVAGGVAASAESVTPNDGPASNDGPALAEATAQPLVEIIVAGEGRGGPGIRHSGTRVGARLRHRAHERHTAPGPDGSPDAWHHLRVDLSDDTTGLAVRVHLAAADGVPAVRIYTEVHNAGDREVVLHAVSTLAAPAWGPHDDPARVELLWAHNDWAAENRWRRSSLRPTLLPDIDLTAHDTPRGRVALTSHGAWSSGAHPPLGALVSHEAGAAWAWQIEHNGAWHAELGERPDGGYLLLSGPTDAEHQWRHPLAPGATFTTVPATLAAGSGPAALEDAVAAMTRHRRRARRPHPDHTSLPVVFNDYMNTLMGDPTTEKLLPLVDAAAAVGAEYFCVDAGWYDDSGDWWDSVGEWRPSTTRFPDGLAAVLAHIRAAGMVPGLWLEPEVVGVRSLTAERLPDDAFFLASGRRQIENGRHHLDLRHPAARAHLDAVVDRLVTELGVGYLKLDHNINPGPGTDTGGAAPGAGLLGHNRAYLAWLDGVLDRHPHLVLENCASGAMRCDHALLDRMQLQSTSDQQNPERYPPIAAAAPFAVTPEQSGSWAYPQPDMTPEEIAFTMCTGMLGRLYLSGHLDRMTEEQRALVAEGVTTYRDLRGHVRESVPFWPLGLPAWDDPWVALGLSDGPTHHLALWRRTGADPELTLTLPRLRGRRLRVDPVYPTTLPTWPARWDPASATLRVRAAGHLPAARLFRLTTDG